MFRAKLILMLAEGASFNAIKRQLQTTAPTIVRWKQRFRQYGLEGLEHLIIPAKTHNLLFRWFVGLNLDDAIWDVTVFTKNRERLLDGDIAEALRQTHLLSVCRTCWK